MTRRTRPGQGARIPIAVRNGSDLCLQCGLCCDGTFFQWVTMQPGEEALVESLGLVHEQHGSGRGFPAPCTAFLDGCCSLYEIGRPFTCGSYQCGPLQQYLAGTSEREECLEVLRLAQGTARALEDTMGIAPGTFTRTEMHRFLAEHDPRAHADEFREFLVRLNQLVHLGMRYFGYDTTPSDELEDQPAM